MARKKGKKVSRARRPKKTGLSPPLDPLRAGMPALDSITGVEEFKSGRKLLRVIHTSEVDAYEEPPSKTKNKPRKR